MGSGFSIINNSNEAVWVYIGVNRGVLFGVVGGLATLATAGAAAAVAAPAGGAGVAAAYATGEAAAFIGADAVLVHAIGTQGLPPLSVSGAAQYVALEGIDQATRDACREINDEIKTYNYKKIEPGGRHDFDGTLSLTMVCHIITDRTMQRHQKTVVTAGTAGNVNEYYVTSIIDAAKDEERIKNYSGAFYWQAYGNNHYIKIGCSSSTVRKYGGSYPSRPSNELMEGYYWRENENASNVWVAHRVHKPKLGYCADTYYYSYHDNGKWPEW